MSFLNIRYIPKPDTVGDFGCDTKGQLTLWRPEICGVCCLKMIGDTKRRTLGLSLWQLTQKCIDQGAFKVDNKTGVIDGIFHYPMMKVAHDLGLHGVVLPRLPLGLIKFLLLLHIAPILSIDLHKLDAKYEAGHLVVMVGYNKKDKAFVVHDPSSVLAKSGKFAHINVQTLKRITNNRGMVLF